MFRKATKTQAKLRLALAGPSGSGKTFSALRIARGLVGPEGRIAVLDTEHASSEKYAGDFDFDVAPITHYHPRDYLQVIQAAEQAGYDCLIIDSLSHEWAGPGGILELVDKASGNKYANGWGKATPLHQQFIESILKPRLHIIGTMRSKTAYVLEKQKNRAGREVEVPVKVGMAPIQRDGFEYEFDVLVELDIRGGYSVTKTRCSALRDHSGEWLDEGFGQRLRAWLDDGAEQPRQQDAPPQPHRTESAPPPQRPRVVQRPQGPPEPPESWEAPTMPTSPQMAQWGPGMAESWPRWEYALRQLTGWDGAQMALSRVGAWTAEQGWGRVTSWDEVARLNWWADRAKWGPACVAATQPKRAAGGAG